MVSDTVGHVSYHYDAANNVAACSDSHPANRQNGVAELMRIAMTHIVTLAQKPCFFAPNADNHESFERLAPTLRSVARKFISPALNLANQSHAPSLRNERTSSTDRRNKADALPQLRKLMSVAFLIVAGIFLSTIASTAHATVTSQQAYKNCMTDVSLLKGSVFPQYFASSSCIWIASTPTDGAYYITSSGQGNVPCSGVSSYIAGPFGYDCWATSAYTPPSGAFNLAKNLGDGGACSGTCGGGTGKNAASGASGAVGNAAMHLFPRSPQMVGDPINASTGDTYLQDDDYVDPADWLTFRRFYNNDAYAVGSAAGVQWRHSFDRSLVFSAVNGQSQITLFRPDDRQEFFTKVNGQWKADPDNPDILTESDNAQGQATGYTVFVTALHQFETYDPASGQLQGVVDETGRGVVLSYSTSHTPTSVAPHAGLLLKVTDSQGRQLNFNYDNSGYLHQTILPDAATLTYSYDSNGNLTSVTYPDNTARQYVYNESSLNGGTNQPNAMTGIVDEASVRYERTAFNSAGKAISTSFAGNTDLTQVTYNSDGTSTVKYPLGASITMGYAVVNGVVKAASVNQLCGAQCGLYWKSRTFDAQGNPASETDFNGNVTKTTYDANGLLDQQIDASGTPNQRTTNTTWNTTLRVPLTRVALDANSNTVSSTQWVYNAAGQTLARCEIDPTNNAASGYTCSASGTVPAGVRRWTYTYCTAVDTTQCPLVGLLLTATGPRTDLTQTTSYSYYMSASAVNCGTPGAACHQPGDLYQVTDPAGHVTTIASYDADGRVTRETDANGINTDLTYTPRGWLASRTVGGAQTSFSYTPYGAVSSVTDPDGVITSYGYDAAHRLVKITDAQGNYLQYTLDAAGNKTAEQVFDSSGTAHKSLSRTFNPLGQLTTVVDGLSHTVFNASAAGNYDANGNLVQSSDGLGIERQSSYDALDRLVQTIDNYNGTN